MPVAVRFCKRKLTVRAPNFLHTITANFFKVFFTVVILIADEVREKILIDREGIIVGRYGGGGESHEKMDEKLKEVFGN